MANPAQGEPRTGSPAEASDEELLQGIVAEDVEALESLYARYGGLAFSLALRITGSREAAEDVVQEAFLSAWRRALTYKPERGSARSWLLGIIHNRAIDAVRARRVGGPTVPLDEGMPLAAKDNPLETVEQNLDREAIRRAMTTLPDEQRQSIELAYFSGFSYPEIAQRLGVPLGTIKSRMRLGLEKLRVLMADSNALESETR